MPRIPWQTPFVLLYAVAFLAGLITAISPCIIPVLPIIMASATPKIDGEEAAERRRPVLIVLGLVLSFSILTLFGKALLAALDLPTDLLYWLGIGLLFVVGVSMLIPRLEGLLEKPFLRLGRIGPAKKSRGFLLGMSFGLVFAPCAGPIFVAITTAGNQNHVGIDAVALTFFYAIGLAIPLIILGVISQKAVRSWSKLRTHLLRVRKVGGVVLAAMALVLAFNLTGPLKTISPGYVTAIAKHTETSKTITKDLHADHLAPKKHFKTQTTQEVQDVSLPKLGKAPNFTKIKAWLNTPGDKPINLSSLRGHVVLVDFWTYSCINCERSLPHVEAWYSRYHADGLDVIGVHTPEFPFEYVVSNVKAAASRLGVKYPIAIDDTYGTWNAYGNDSWPAEYLIDQEGNVRYTSIGEGQYTTTENAIRQLLQVNPKVSLPPPTHVPNKTPSKAQTTETYLGSERFTLQRYVGSPVIPTHKEHYTLSTNVPQNSISLGGTWTQHEWTLTAGTPTSVTAPKIALSFEANDVYLVLGGDGTVSVTLDGKSKKTIHVHGVPDLYTIYASDYGAHLVTLTFTRGVQAYDFTFG